MRLGGNTRGDAGRRAGTVRAASAEVKLRAGFLLLVSHRCLLCLRALLAAATPGPGSWLFPVTDMPVTAAQPYVTCSSEKSLSSCPSEEEQTSFPFL